MIGTHNSFTYIDSTSKLYNKFSDFWRCQGKTIQEQYECGARYFDVRVTSETRGSRICWRVCHGKVDLGQTFISLKAIDAYFKKYKDATYRLGLERGDTSKFIKDVNSLVASGKSQCKMAFIKDPWKTIFQASDHLPLTDMTYIPWNTGKDLWYNITHFKLDTIAHHAKKENTKLTNDMIEDPNHIYFIDYI